MSRRGPSLAARVYLLPGRPHRSVVEEAMRRLERHTEPTIRLVGIGGGDPFPPGDPVTSFGAYWETNDDMAVEVTLEPPGGTAVWVTRDRAGGAQGWLSLSWALDPTLTEGFVDLLVDLSELLASPLAVLSHSAPGRERAGWASRAGAHQAAVREAAAGGPWTYSLACGLAGIAHRMVLGPQLAAMLGEDRLGRLPSSQAERRNGRWLLATTDDPLEWTYDRWCPEEAAVIKAVEPELVFDPETGRLPSEAPTLPRHAPYRCSYVDPATGERVEHDPGRR